MPLQVLLSGDAERDMEDIYRYIARRDSPGHADHVVAELENIIAALEEYPERGNVPKELASIGIAEYREAHFKPYRIIYRLHENAIVIYCVFDGRRDVQTFLQRRLLR